jgi:hypothetical protein
MGLASRLAMATARMARARCPAFTHRQAMKVPEASVISDSSSHAVSDPLAGNGGRWRIAYQH